MTKPYSVAFKQKMVERLTGKNAMSANQLSKETGVRQQNLSRWLTEARSLPHVGTDLPHTRHWTVDQKARLLADAAALKGEELLAWTITKEAIVQREVISSERVQPPPTSPEYMKAKRSGEAAYSEFINSGKWEGYTPPPFPEK